ncbi:MAG: hypothetical protein H6613_03365 [Ignavibacteriales bacterium]|nr:hypothetical protein [Ignavibacteriales bacterium]
MKVIFIIIIFSTFLHSQPDHDASSIIYGSCPFECCQFGQWIIKDSINVYPNEGDTNSISFVLNDDDTVFAETGNLHFYKLGKF